MAERWRTGDVVLAGEERFARTLVQQGLLHPQFPPHVDLDDVDVVVPVRDDVASLRQLLWSLRALHVTVVDDGSTSPQLVAECAQHRGAALIRLDENVGPAGARNAGIAATSRPFIWFIDVDVVLDAAPDVGGRLRATLDDPLVAAVAPRIRGGVGSSRRDSFERAFSPLDLGPHKSLVIPGAAVGYVPSACLLVRRDALGDGFDATLRTGEDVDLVWRLHDRGWLVRYDADVVATHRARGDWRHWWNQRVSYGASSGELARRHGLRLAPVRVDPWTLVAWASLLNGQPALATRVHRAVRRQLGVVLGPSVERPEQLASEVVTKSMLRAGLPLARSIVRTYGVVVLATAFHPRLRRRALVLFAVGTGARWRSSRLRVADIPLAVADDLAYGLGVVQGAWRAKTIKNLTPHITKSSVRLKDVLALSRRTSPLD